MTSAHPLPPIVFVGGIHGVGKTTFSKELAGRNERLHYSAGALIAEHIKAEKSSDKKVADVSGNQHALIAALRSLQTTSPIVLDGHFCLIDTQSKIQQVPPAVFESLRPELVILLRDEPAHIQKRLHSRDGRQYDVGFISEFQDREVEHGQEIAQLLGVPCLVCTGEDLDIVALQLPHR